MRFLSIMIAAVLAIAWAPAATAGEHAVGFTAGGTSGAGFTYRYFGASQLGGQVTGLFIATPGSTYGVFGTQLLLSVREVGWGRLYGLAGIAFYQGMSPLFGLGPGIEIGGDRGSALAIELPITAFAGGVYPLPNVSYLFKF